MTSLIALETSCDESAVAILTRNSGRIKILSSNIASQVEEHSRWGGVVPEIASRMHLEAIPFLIESALKETGLTFKDFDAVASTVAPGLSGALLTGSITARTLSCIYELPFIGVHHLEGHLASIDLLETPPEMPYLVLLVSGGHTELIKVTSKGCYLRLGRSHDDAAGEAFDKVARLLGLSYPGGPAIEKISASGNPDAFKLPKGKVSNPKGGYYPYDFSFSGLKTSMLRLVEALNSSEKELPISDLAASFENIVAEVLVERSLNCAIDNSLSRLVLVGGVASNKRLRKLVSSKAALSGVKIFLAPMAYCTDNAAMIGAAAINRLEYGYKKSSLELGVSARWPLEESHLLYDRNPPF
tara:strand:- start:2145 stop:3215 length:1071 start_codon:yes stop_codon:yes gene_type:complete